EAQQWLSTQPDEELTELATQHGLSHAELVSPKAAAAWLHPATDEHAKHKIQKLAQQHYEEQIAAGTVTVLTPSEVPEGCWEATPAELLAAQSTFTLAYTETSASKTADADSFAMVVDAETKIATAHCPQAPHEAQEAASAASIGVDKLAHLQSDAAIAWVKEQQHNGAIPDDAL